MYAVFSEGQINFYNQFKCFCILKTGIILLEMDIIPRVRNMYAKFEPQLLILHHTYAGSVLQAIVFLFGIFFFVFYFRGRQTLSVALISCLFLLSFIALHQSPVFPVEVSA